jgi:hypothetical protein
MKGYNGNFNTGQDDEQQPTTADLMKAARDSGSAPKPSKQESKSSNWKRKYNMKNERLMSIKEQVARCRKHADRIMDGGDNYDGADGAREVQDLCDIASELIEAIEGSLKP